MNTARLAGPDANIFAVGDPDQGSIAFGEPRAPPSTFQQTFPSTKLVVLEKNRRSTTPILRTAFALIDQNPPVAAKYSNGALDYKRLPLQSSREEEALKAGLRLPSTPVQAIILTSRMPKERTSSADPRPAKENEM